MKHNNAASKYFGNTVFFDFKQVSTPAQVEMEVELTPIQSNIFADPDKLSRLLPKDCWQVSTLDRGFNLNLYSHPSGDLKREFVACFGGYTHLSIYRKCFDYLLKNAPERLRMRVEVVS